MACLLMSFVLVFCNTPHRFVFTFTVHYIAPDRWVEDMNIACDGASVVDVRGVVCCRSNGLTVSSGSGQDCEAINGLE